MAGCLLAFRRSVHPFATARTNASLSISSPIPQPPNSSFNILPVHETLVSPTRGRMRLVILISGCCTLLMYLAIAVAGYLYALDDTMVRVECVGCACAAMFNTK